MNRHWYKGDTHLHTTGSWDGHLHQYELIDRCKELGLDWMIITDHNNNTLDKSYSSDGLTVIQGQEVTGDNGHVNMWGAKVAYDPPYDLSNLDAYKKIAKATKDNGATICVNHPFCTNCGFRLDLDDFPMDCVEVWNTIQHSDNIKNMNWWVNKLNQGIKIGAVGGSDFHQNVAGLDLLAMPTTITHAKSNSPQDILQALREGRSVVTNKPNTSMIYLTVDDAELGDTIELNGTFLVGKCKVTKLLPNHTIKIFNNNKIVYQYTAKTYEKEHTAVFEIRDKGYVRAQIDYKFSPAIKKLYTLVEKKFLKGDGQVPDFFWAFTNPIWIK
jgi:predicted metal-dependent phosphoesterase TrpH